MTRKESLEYYQGLELKEMFDIMDTKILTRTAQLFDYMSVKAVVKPLVRIDKD